MGLRRIHTQCDGFLTTTPDIATADDDRDFDAELMNCTYFACVKFKHALVNRLFVCACEGFTTEFEEDAFELRSSHDSSIQQAAEANASAACLV
jgi:hypothetical protein